MNFRHFATCAGVESHGKNSPVWDNSLEKQGLETSEWNEAGGPNHTENGKPLQAVQVHH